MTEKSQGEQPRDRRWTNPLLLAVLVIFGAGLTYHYAVGAAYDTWATTPGWRVLGGWLAVGLPTLLIALPLAARMPGSWPPGLMVAGAVLWIGLLAGAAPPLARSGPAGPGYPVYEGGAAHLAGLGWGLLGFLLGVLLLAIAALRTAPATPHRRPLLLAVLTGPVLGALLVAMLRSGVGGS